MASTSTDTVSQMLRRPIPLTVALPGASALDHQVMSLLDGRWRLMASRCSQCAQVHYPPHEVCPVDLAASSDVVLSDTGLVFEAVRVAIAPEGFEAPYWAAYVDLPEGVRVFGLLWWDEDSEQTPTSGVAVRLRIAVVREDPAVLGVVFVPTSYEI